MKRFSPYALVLAFLAVVGVGLGGCALISGSDRAPLYEVACLSQCPIAYTLLKEKCEEIDEVEKPTYRQACLDEVEAFRLACPLICAELNQPEPDVEVIVVE